MGCGVRCAYSSFIRRDIFAKGYHGTGRSNAYRMDTVKGKEWPDPLALQHGIFLAERGNDLGRR